MGDFSVADWTELIDLDVDQIVVKNQGGRFDDELIFFEPQTTKKPIILPKAN